METSVTLKAPIGTMVFISLCYFCNCPSVVVCLCELRIGDWLDLLAVYVKQ